MFRCFIVLTLLAVICHCLPQNIQVAPPAQPQPVFCGIQPDNILKCLGNPKILNPEATKECLAKKSECERLTCVFKKSGWMDAKGYQVKRQKVIEHFDQFAREHPEWSQAVQHVKTGCLAMELPAQGRYLNCPAFDVLHCALTGFYRNAPASQWSTAADCAYPQQFAASCPVCPEDCFGAAIPTGSCNACRLLPTAPRTP